jgi:hypothetical protein
MYGSVERVWIYKYARVYKGAVDRVFMDVEEGRKE